MAQERVRRTRVNRDHRSFRKPWSVGWALWWRGAGLGIPEEGLLLSLRPSHAWGNPLSEMGAALPLVGGEGMDGEKLGEFPSHR